MRYTVEQFKKIIAEEILVVPKRMTIRNFITHYYELLPDFFRKNEISDEQFQIFMNNLGDGKYLIDDGCHRIYASYLAGKQTVTCKIRGEIKKS